MQGATQLKRSKGDLCNTMTGCSNMAAAHGYGIKADSAVCSTNRGGTLLQSTTGALLCLIGVLR